MKKHESAPKQKQPNYKLRRGVAGAAVAGLLAAGGAFMLESGDDKVNSHFDKVEQEAIQEAETAWDSVVVLHGGAKVRTAPKTVNNNPELGRDTNAFTVEDGLVVVVTNPVVHRERSTTRDGEDIWLGFTHPNGSESEQNTEDVYWVNYTELQRQSDNEHNYIDVYNPANESEPAGQYHVHGFDGQFFGSLTEGDNKGGPLAYASTMSEQAFEHYVADTGIQKDPLK